MTDAPSSFPGERLGLPRTGPRSIGRLGRRVVALAIDYVAATIIAGAFFQYDQFALPAEAGWTMFSPLLIFAVVQILFIPIAGGSPGHRISGMRVIRADGAWTGLWRPVVRTVLLILVIPAVIWDSDQRGLHDKIAGTVVIRS